MQNRITLSRKKRLAGGKLEGTNNFHQANLWGKNVFRNDENSGADLKIKGQICIMHRALLKFLHVKPKKHQRWHCRDSFCEIDSVSQQSPHTPPLLPYQSFTPFKFSISFFYIFSYLPLVGKKLPFQIFYLHCGYF